MSRFEDYILTKTSGRYSGLVDVSDKSFMPLLGSASQGYIDDVSSDIVDIGFTMSFDNKEYSRIVVNTNGWFALVDPTETSASDVATALLLSSSWQNEGINLSNSTDSVLFCPWFDDLKNVALDAYQASALITTANIRRQTYGFDNPSIIYDSAENAVKLFRQKNSPYGRRTIIRWSSLSDFNNASTRLKFEAVLYETGEIEFRYFPRRNARLYETKFGANFIEDATIGVFAPGTNRFRDFSYGLGYSDSNRQMYRYGGAVYSPNYSDSGFDTFTSTTISRNYTWRLRPATHWPGLDTFGTTFKFSPVKSRRKTSPKRITKLLDSKPQFRTGLFDDRQTVNFSSNVVVNYPTTLPRFYGDQEISLNARQNLFSGEGNELELTGSIVRSSIESFVDSYEQEFIKPFNDIQIDESDVFYSSSISSISETFNASIKSKETIRFSLPINFNTRLLETSASIYYYNSRNKSWVIPSRAVSDLADPVSDATNGRILEDHRGFGPIGTMLGSGSTTVDNTGSVAAKAIGRDHYINFPYTSAQIGIDAMLQPLEKSVFVNNDYKAINDEIINPPITEPFLLEKAVIEIPLAAGADWFNVKTTSFLPLVSSMGSFDFAGPGLTFALFNQINSGYGYRRELILSGVITHNLDLDSSIEITNFPSLDSTYQVRPTGFLSYASQPAGIVKQNVGSTFTGSVVLKTEAGVSNGVILKMSKDMNVASSGEYPTNRSQVLNLLSTESVQVESGSGLYSIGYNVGYVNPFGRGNKIQSGRSIFGGDYASVFKTKVKNPFYTTGSSLTTISSSLSTKNTFRAVAALPMISHVRSPYILMPGDQLIVALAKSRPHYYSNGLGGPETSGSLSPDLQLITGSVNITLYGSFLRESEAVDSKKDFVQTNAIRTVIGDSPIYDQFETMQKEQLYGSMDDDYVTGSIVSLSTTTNRTNRLITGSRGRVFSKIYSREQLPPSASFESYETFVNPSKSFRLQGWWERSSIKRFVSYSDEHERIFDTMMPNIATCFKADGTGIWVTEYDGKFLNTPGKIEVNDKTGFMLFDQQLTAIDDFLKLRNGNWTKSFPYEPRYAGVTRQHNLSRTFVATQRNTSSGVVETEPVKLDNLILGIMAPVPHEPSDSDMHWFSDVQLYTTSSKGYYVTSSMSDDDTIKVLFGFGDENTCFIAPTGDRIGTNHWLSWRDSEPSNINNVWTFGPIIRGWKYGVYSGLPMNTKAIFRRSHYGQFRDMLEQREFTKCWVQRTSNLPGANVTVTSPITVKFVDSNGNLTNPENTSSQNLSNESTSSFPFFDGIEKNRNAINKNTQNKTLLSIKYDKQGNISL